VAACDALAPEHLQLVLRDADAVAPRLAHYGALFVGAGSAEVLGDYGAGPNHVAAGRAAPPDSAEECRSTRSCVCAPGSALTTPLGSALIEDAVWLGRAEGLEAHARAAERRL